jgi:hypothetical protein
LFWNLTRPTFNRTPVTPHVEVIPKENFKSHTPPFKETSLDTLANWLGSIDVKRKSCFVHKEMVFELLKMEANWLFSLNWFDPHNQLINCNYWKNEGSWIAIVNKIKIFQHVKSTTKSYLTKHG